MIEVRFHGRGGQGDLPPIKAKVGNSRGLLTLPFFV